VLPRIIARAGAAEKVIPDTIDTSTVKLNKNRYKPEDLILVEVAGNSMTPTFQDGELLLFKKFNTVLVFASVTSINKYSPLDSSKVESPQSCESIAVIVKSVKANNELFIKNILINKKRLKQIFLINTLPYYNNRIP
jgi:hypothetical protein